MADNRQKLLHKWKNDNLYSNFGAAIKSMTINGFRGISDLTINFEYPITAISGINGSGKSTIGQLAVCAYRQLNHEYKRRYINEFFPVNKFDLSPFTNDANVKFQYANENAQIQNLKISRFSTGWSGYQRQPTKNVFYIGFALFIPKIERKDFSVYNSNALIGGDKRLISNSTKVHVSSILNNYYDEIAFQGISDNIRQTELGIVKKSNCMYSENNMGFGEARLMYIVDILESRPNKSLFVLEEPETSLHEDAQYKFVKYLMDVCLRKGHQVILSTHSSIILEALPSEGRKFIFRSKQGVNILNRVSANRAKSILTDGQTKALTICVEDVFAALVLKEAIRNLKPDLLPLIQIFPMGDVKAVADAVALLISQNVKVIGVRDADKGEDKIKKLFKLPGTLPPEKEVYENKKVQAIINAKYSIDIKTIFSMQHSLDHHAYGKLLSEKTYCSEEVLNNCAIYAYFDAIGIKAFDNLIQNIEREM